MTPVAQRWFAALGAADAARLDSLLAPDVELTDPAGQRVTGRRAVTRWLTDPWTPPGTTVRVIAVSEAHGISVAILEIDIPVGAGGRRTERAVMAVTATATSIRRIVLDD